MNENGRNFAVGLTAVAAVVGLAFMMLLFGYLPKFLEEGYNVQVELPDAGGLYQGSRVRYGGLDIGRVETIQRMEPGRPEVKMVLYVNPEETLPDNVYAFVEQPLLGGGSTLILAIEQGQMPSETHLSRDGSALIAGRDVVTLTELIQRVSTGLTEAVDDFTALSEEWTLVGAQVNALIEPRAPGDVDAGSMMANVTTVMARADQRLIDLEQAINGLDALVNDPELVAQIRDAVGGASELTTSLNATLEDLGDDLNDNFDVLTERYIAVADDLSAAVASMRQLLDDANSGEGTMGRLMQDPSLYENLDDTAVRLQQAIDELILTLQKWNDEGVPVRF